MYICPICQHELMPDPKSWQCCQPQKSHSFDVARQGYVNLLPVQYKKSKQPGDSPEAILARQRFLNQGGFYQPLQQKITEVLRLNPITHLLDIGCGEGYYTQALQTLSKQLTAIDISKAGVIQTAKLCRRHPYNATCLVASANRLPLQTGCVDVITSIFSPIVADEFARVLTTGGKLLIAKPANKHLLALRTLLFDEVRQHNSDKFIEQLADNFWLSEQHTVNVNLLLNEANLADLMTMTPYAYRAKAAKRVAVLAQAPLKVTAQFHVYVFGKK